VEKETMSTFPAFNPPENYPRPNFQDINLEAPFPTSSWFQEGIVNNIADVDRIANGTPWYIKPIYDNVQIGLSFGSIDDVTTVLDYGNVILQEAPRDQINIGIENADQLTLKNLTDLSCQLQYSDENTTLAECNFVRGSPTVSFNVTNASIIFNSLSGLLSLNRIGTSDTYFLNSVIPIASTVSAPLIPVGGDPNLNESTNLAFYRFVHPIPNETVQVMYGIIDGENRISATYTKDGQPFHLNMFINNPNIANSTFPDNYTLSLQIGDRVLGFVLTNMQTNEVDKIIVDIETKIASVIRVVQEQHRWILYTNASIVNLDQGTATVRTNRFTGYFRIAYGGRIVEDQIDFFGQTYPLDSQLLAKAFSRGTISQGTIPSNFAEMTDGDLVSWSYQMIYDSPGVLFLPPHLVSDNFILQGVELHPEPISYLSVTYGRLQLYNIPTGTILIQTQPISIEEFQNVTNLLTTPTSQRLMRNLILVDIDDSLSELATITEGDIVVRRDLNPYNFGLIIAKAARVLLLAVQLQDQLRIEQFIIDILQLVIRANLTSWLDGTNNPPGIDTFQLQRDPIWGGIIVPADSNNLSENDSPTAYGNSFYNDHHFQYGYIVYALAVLERLDFGLFSEYPANVLDLVQDYANHNFNRFTRLRHKDLFFGHSWATGVPGLPTDTPGTLEAGDVNRQQESAGEAINAYFASYLLGKEIRNTQLRTASGVALYLEIIAARFYYLYDSPESDLGNLASTGSIGIIQTLGKSYTLNWVMQPPTFPGRSFGIHGIQVLPFTEITGNYFMNELTPPFSSAISRYAERMAQFGMSFEIVRSVLDGTYTPNPAFQGPNTAVPYAVKNDGFYWGNVAMMLLSFSREAASDRQIRELFGLILNQLRTHPSRRILKSFDSFSNTYYILLRLRGANITPTCQT